MRDEPETKMKPAIFVHGSDKEFLDAIQELAEYLGESGLATAFNVGNSLYAIAAAWRNCNPKTEGEVTDFYRNTKQYLEQLTFANYGIPGQVEIRKFAAKSFDSSFSVLDLGAGIGSTLIDMPQTDKVHADVGGVIFEYARWRYARRRMPVNMFVLPQDYYKNGWLPNERQFNLVICTEVIEHVLDPAGLVEYLSRVTKPGGFLIATVSFHNENDMHPCHLNCDKWTNERFVAEVFPKFGFTRNVERPYLFRKEESHG